MKRSQRFDFKPLGLAIKSAREAKGESRTVASAAVGISANELVCIETRGQHPSFQTLYELTTRYGISVDEYFSIKSADHSFSENSKSNKRMELDKLLDGVSDGAVDVLVATAKALSATDFGDDTSDAAPTEITIVQSTARGSAGRATKTSDSKTDKKTSRKKSTKATVKNDVKPTAKRGRKPKAK